MNEEDDDFRVWRGLNNAFLCVIKIKSEERFCYNLITCFLVIAKKIGECRE